MLRYGNDYLNMAVHATDGYCGVVHDVYFDDEAWAVRYFAVMMSEGEGSRVVLVPVPGVSNFQWLDKTVHLSLDHQRLTESPEFRVDLPVSRQYELALHRYYEWPVYWGQTSFLDTPDTKKLDRATIPTDRQNRPDTVERGNGILYGEDDDAPDMMEALVSSEPEEYQEEELRFDDEQREEPYSASLRSMRELCSYSMTGGNGEEAGRIEDIVIDEGEENLIPFLKVKPGTGDAITKSILLPHTYIEGIEWEQSSVVSSLLPVVLREAPGIVPGNTPVSDYINAVLDYYESIAEY